MLLHCPPPPPSNRKPSFLLSQGREAQTPAPLTLLSPYELLRYKLWAIAPCKVPYRHVQLTIFSAGEKMRGGTTCPTGEIGAAKGERKRRTKEREKGGWPTLRWSVWLDRSRVAGLCELRFLSLSSGGRYCRRRRRRRRRRPPCVTKGASRLLSFRSRLAYSSPPAHLPLKRKGEAGGRRRASFLFLSPPPPPPRWSFPPCGDSVRT